MTACSLGRQEVVETSSTCFHRFKNIYIYMVRLKDVKRAQNPSSAF